MNPTVLVTGASRGIGRAIAIRFAQEGYNVAMGCHSHPEQAYQVSEKLNKAGMQTAVLVEDLATVQGACALVRQTQELFGRLDVLVNNAGISQFGLFTDLTQGDWEKIRSVNLDAPLWCAREAARLMIPRKEGSIVNIASMWGETGASCETAYSTTKAALIGMTKALAKELGPSGIRVNGVSPGVIDTEMNAHLGPQALEELAEETPLGRIGTAQEIAAAVFFLAGKEASFITGQVLGVNGGFLI